MADWLGVARSSVERGASHDEVARDLIAAGAPPVEAIKAIRTVLGLRLAVAKAIFHAQLSPEAQAAAERIWDAAERSLEIE